MHRTDGSPFGRGFIVHRPGKAHWPSLAPYIARILRLIALPRGPEADTRRDRIDVMLRDAGGVIQDRKDLNTHAGLETEALGKVNPS